MGFQLTFTDVCSITDDEALKGSIRLLPERNIIPIEFWNKQNAFNKLAHRWFCFGIDWRDVVFLLRKDFYDNDGQKKQFEKFIIANIKHFYVEHDYKIAGVAFLMYLSSEQYLEDLMFS